MADEVLLFQGRSTSNEHKLGGSDRLSGAMQFRVGLSIWNMIIWAVIVHE
jgi:hypothetical protein